MKKIFSTIISSPIKGRLCGLLFALLATTTLWAYDFQSGDLYYNITSSSAPYTVEVDDATSSITIATIPETVNYNGTTYSVTSIGGSAFSWCSSLSSITIPNSVTSIGSSAFYYCSSLTSITIPNSITSIGSYVFYYCWSLTSITIPYSVTSIGNEAFRYCSSLTSITIPNSVTSIGRYAFKDCSSLTSITIPNSVTSIGELAFYSCIFVKENFVNNSVLDAEENNYWGASIGDTEINGLLIRNDTVIDCRPNVTSVIIPNSVTSIGEAAFSGCSSLTSITIPNSVTSIGDLAFSGCSSLTSITIPNSVTSIGRYAFSNCSSLTSITIPNSVTSIGEWAFSNCIFTKDKFVNNSTLDAQANNYWGARIVDTEIDGLLIRNDTVIDCRPNVTSVIIPNSVTSIGNSAFASCSSLTSVTIPNSVTSIEESAFASCFSLTSVTIGNSVTSIGESAFNACFSLTSVTIGNSVTSIGERAFQYCFSLTSVTIGNSVTSIGKGAFEGTNLTSFICYSPSLTSSFEVYLGTQPQLDTIIAPAAFFDVEEADWASAPKHVRYARVIAGELTENAFGVINRSYKTLKVLDLEAVTNTSIADEAFKGCYNLDSLYLPSNLTYIPYMAIAECKSLKSITIPATVEEIDNSAFENCRSIKSIIFEGVEPVQGSARYAAASGSSLWRIGSWAFYNCHQLQNLTIPEGVTEVGDAAFYGCTYLEDMVLPSTIQEIGDNGFALCAKLQKIHVEAVTPPTIQAKTFFDVNRQIPVYVPDNAVEAYKADPYWQEFNIIGKSNAPSAVDNISSPNADTHKLLHNGQLLILRDGKTYNIMGAEIK